MVIIIVLQVLLGFTLFFIVNWIGKHSYSVGYISLSVFVKVDEAPGYNLIIRILTPVIYLLITSSILYALKLDRFIHNYYMVSFYYIVIRLVVNLITHRGILLNWYKQIIYWSGIMFTSYYAYNKIIVTKNNLLPDFNNLANELWIVIIVFLYNIFNKIEFSNETSIKRKNNYIESKFLGFKEEYGDIINALYIKRLIAIAYSILIYEDFNRPYAVRLIENATFFFIKKPRTLGVMQVLSNTFINDRQSVELGVAKIKNKYAELLENPKDYYDDKQEWLLDYYIKNDLISDFNGGEKYEEGVKEMLSILEMNFFKDNPKEHF